MLFHSMLWLMFSIYILLNVISQQNSHLLDKLYKYAAQSEHCKPQNSISSVSQESIQQYKRQQWERGGQT